MGVDGVAPSAPNADYSLANDGSNTIDIADIDKTLGSTFTIRVKGDSNQLPKVTDRSYWTDGNGENIGKIDPAEANA